MDNEITFTRPADRLEFVNRSASYRIGISMRHGSVGVGSRARGSADTTIFMGKIASSVRPETVEALVGACGELKVRGGVAVAVR